MKQTLKELRKKGIVLGIIFLCAGVIISAAGFGMGGFKLDYLREEGTPKWYRTVHLTDNNLWFGIGSDDARIQMSGISLPD